MDVRGVALSRRDRAVILLALVGVTAIAWLYLLVIGQGMSGMTMPDIADMAIPMAAPWTLTAFALTFAMWRVMMLGASVAVARILCRHRSSCSAI